MRSVLLLAAVPLLVACGTSGRAATAAPTPSGADDGGAPEAGLLPTVPIDSGGDTSAPPSPPIDAALPPVLTGLHIDLSQTSVSGISSGGFMAVQFGVAFSSIIEGIGVFAGGPFDCSQGSVTAAENACGDATSSPDVTPMIAATKSLAVSGAIDATSYLASERIFLFGGADDAIVSPLVMDSTQT